MKPFSVLMSVYKLDKPDYFRTAVESISIKQTVKPNEVLIVVDGPVPDDLRSMIEFLAEEISYVHILWQKENKGLGTALQVGMENASNEIVARMDSDDIAINTRFAKQLPAFDEDPALSIIGSSISEFVGDPYNVVGRRDVPTTNEEIRKYMKSRCAFNHMTVMYKRSEVMKVGNYQDWYWNEDYYLWIRMMLGGCRFANISEPLVKVRVGKDMYARRGSIRYFKSEVGIQTYMYKHNIIAFPRYCFNVFVRFVIQVLMPNKVRGGVFRLLFRSK